MRTKLIFKLSLPPTTNHQYCLTCRGGKPRKYLTVNAVAWKQETGWMLKSSDSCPVEPWGCNVKATVHFYLKRDRDIDNCKLLWDSMEGIIFKNDKQVVETHKYKKHTKGEPYLEIEIEEVKGNE